MPGQVPRFVTLPPCSLVFRTLHIMSCFITYFAVVPTVINYHTKYEFYLSSSGPKKYLT